MATMLVLNGADIHAKDGMPLALAAGGGHLDLVKFLVEEAGGKECESKCELDMNLKMREGGLCCEGESSSIAHDVNYTVYEKVDCVVRVSLAVLLMT